MGLAFAAGWPIGAKTGDQGFDDVISTARGIFSSKEFQDFLAAVRSHAAFALRELGDLVDTEETETPSGDLVDENQGLLESLAVGTRSSRTKGRAG